MPPLGEHSTPVRVVRVGSLSGYQRAQVRCTVAQSWDGGDDSDSTYVAEVWYRQELTCWGEPGESDELMRDSSGRSR